MQYGICNLNVIPVRKSPGHTTEMVTQLIFGETFDILDFHENWVQVLQHADQYTGWIHHLQYLPITALDLDILGKQDKILVNNTNSEVIEQSTGNSVRLVMGSLLPKLSDQLMFSMAKETYAFSGFFEADLKSAPDKDLIPQFAAWFLGAPYLWGGRTHYGIDCSGFTQMAFHLAGFSLPRDASQQVALGETLSFLTEAEPGDLLFFDNPEGDIVHTGILYTENKIIHASGKVRIDTIDHNGIFNAEQGKYTHALRIIKKVKG